jgi:hypothetical protein
MTPIEIAVLVLGIVAAVAVAVAIAAYIFVTRAIRKQPLAGVRSRFYYYQINLNAINLILQLYCSKFVFNPLLL